MSKNETPIWKVLYDVVTNLEGTFTFKDVCNYLNENKIVLNKDSLRDQITICTVNRSSRVNWSYNKKVRIADSHMDFLFLNEDKSLELYKPEVHGVWEIVNEGGKYLVRKKAMNI